MSKVEFEGATAVLAADMRHVLRRIAAALSLAWFAFMCIALFDALGHDWIAALLDMGAAGGFFVASCETWKRQKRYTFATEEPA